MMCKVDDLKKTKYSNNQHTYEQTNKRTKNGLRKKGRIETYTSAQHTRPE